MSPWLEEQKLIHCWLWVHRGNTCTLASVTLASPEQTKRTEWVPTEWVPVIAAKEISKPSLTFPTSIHALQREFSSCSSLSANLSSCDYFSAPRNTISMCREKKKYTFFSFFPLHTTTLPSLKRCSTSSELSFLLFHLRLSTPAVPL